LFLEPPKSPEQQNYKIQKGQVYRCIQLMGSISSELEAIYTPPTTIRYGLLIGETIVPQVKLHRIVFALENENSKSGETGIQCQESCMCFRIVRFNLFG